MKICIPQDVRAEAAEFLQAELGAELVITAPQEEFFLSYEDQRLVLKKNNSNEHGIFVDLAENYQKFSKQKLTSKKDLLARAVGCEKGLRVCDMTLGLASDASRLLYFDAVVTGYEEQELIWALSKEALWRWQKIDPETTLQVHCGSSWEKLSEIINDHDVFYFDPMYSHERSALPKKEMQYLAQITTDTDGDKLLQIVENLVEKKKKVVLKRAPQADYLGERKPRRSVEGKMVRFDVY